MKAKNRVIAGDYEGKPILRTFGKLYIFINSGLKKVAEINLNNETIRNYEVIGAQEDRKVMSAVGRAFVGGLIIGPIGLLAALSAKRKGIYILAVEFHDGKRSLIEIDESLYKEFMKKVF